MPSTQHNSYLLVFPVRFEISPILKNRAMSGPAAQRRDWEREHSSRQIGWVCIGLNLGGLVGLTIE